MFKTFKIGGVHPEANKLSAAKAIVDAQLPKVAIIPLAQHIGAPANAVVQKGDKVKVGQLIGEANGFVSANIHSSVSGTVSKIDVAPDVSGFKKPAVFIDVEGDEWLETIDRSDALVSEIKDDAKTIVGKIKDAGIVGMGGATFPAHVKLAIPEGKKADFLIINGVECEPYLTADHRLMLEKSDELIVGVKILMKAINVTKAYIGIEANKPDAISKLTELCAKEQGIEVVPLKLKYPQGGEKQLINAVSGREVPSGKLPIDAGAVVQNVGTAFAVYEAVQKNKPLIERIVTVTGDTVKEPSNFKARIGTPVAELIAAAGGDVENSGKIISGGPMMGKAMANLESTVTKGTSGILMLNEEKAVRPEAGPCIRCAKCVDACPMGLEPYLLMQYSQRQMWAEDEANHIMDCIECGCCIFSCPAKRPILDYVRLGKNTVGKIIRSRKQ
ncbi:MAG: electron transport complex subunit RsxC [Salinivirgaceae bacterium]|nr:electron transport complex subunit RsxC [Salinivirgaceae bacterium]